MLNSTSLPQPHSPHPRLAGASLQGQVSLRASPAVLHSEDQHSLLHLPIILIREISKHQLPVEMRPELIPFFFFTLFLFLIVLIFNF